MKNSNKYKIRKAGCAASLVKFCLLLLVIIVVTFYFAGGFMVSSAVTKGAEYFGIKAGLGSFVLNPFSQVVTVGDFYVKNPEGYTDNNLIAVKKFHIDTDLDTSIFTSRKVKIDTVQVEGLDLTLEGNYTLLKRRTNIDDLLEKLNKVKKTETEKPAPTADGEDVPPMKFIIDELVVQDCQVRGVINGNAVLVKVPSFTMKELGKKEDGLTATELSIAITNELLSRVVVPVLEGAIKGAVQGASKGEEAGKSATEGIQNAVKSIFGN